MLLLDNRIGSAELLQHIPPGKARLTHLDSGDACFIGNGPDGPVSIGIERKRVNDLAASIRGNRLAAKQLPAMFQTYDYVYLVVEGMWKISPKGTIEAYPRVPVSIQNSAVDSFLNTLQVQSRLIVRQTFSPRHTALLFLNLYSSWSKGWDEHQTLIQCWPDSPVRPTDSPFPASKSG